MVELIIMVFLNVLWVMMLDGFWFVYVIFMMCFFVL